MDYKDRIEGLKSEVIKAKSNFESRLDDLKKQLNNAQNNSEEMEELKIRHAKEMAEHVRESNQKYNMLYQEKLDQEDSLTAQFEREKKKIMTDFEKRLKDLEEKIRKEERIKYTKEMSEFKANMNFTIEELKQKKKEIETNSIQMKISLEGKITDLEFTVKNNNNEISSLKSRISNLEDTIRDLKANQSDQGAQYSQLLEELQNAKDTISDRDREIESLKNELQKMNDLLDQKTIEFDEELKRLRGNMDSNSSSLQEEIANKNKIITDLEKQIRELNQQLSDSEKKYIKYEEKSAKIEAK